jgi:hypothetical protein
MSDYFVPDGTTYMAPTSRALYHATWPTHLGSIMQKGLQPGSDGCVYLAGPKPAHAATFIAIRGGEFDGYTEVEVDGKTATIPNFVQHDHIYVIEIPVDELDPTKLGESGDHSPAAFPADTESYTYDGEIPYNFDWNVYQLDMPK